MIDSSIKMAGSGPIFFLSRALESNITSHLQGCGVRRLLIHQVKSSLSAPLNKSQVASCVESMKKTVVSSAYINVSPDIIDKGKSFVNNVNKVGPKTEPCGTPHMICVFEDFLRFVTVN